MSFSLYIDATLAGVIVGLFKRDSEGQSTYLGLGVHAENARSTHALVELTRSVLSCAHLTLSEIGQVIVATGPGSFTGIKVGLSFAQGLARGQAGLAKVVGVSGLAALAAQSAAGILWVLPSTQTEGYAAYHGADGPEFLIVRLAGATVELLREHTREPIKLPPEIRDWRLLQSWPRLSQLDSPAKGLSALPLPEAAAKLFTSVAQAWQEPQQTSLFQHEGITARYIRMSAPEERRGVSVYGN